MRKLILGLMALCAVAAPAQDEKKVTVSGSVHSEILIPQEDVKIGAEKPDD